MQENFSYEPQDLVLPRQETLGKYTAKTFLLMFVGLLVTFSLAWFLACTNTGFFILLSAEYYVPALSIILAVAQLVVVLVMSAMIRKLSPAAATVCFFIYSVLTGITFSCYFLIYKLPMLVLIFGFTALYFGGMALFGYLTNIDLSKLRYVLLGGLIAIIVANVLMLFIPGLAVMDRLICTAGVVIFLAFTAYDTQKIKGFYYGFQGDDAMLKKASIISALELYLDFINLFLYLLRLFGKSNRN